MTSQVLVNGEPDGRVPVFDRGFRFGDGLFETIAVRRGRPLLWERHLARLARGAKRLGISMPPETLWRAEAERLCEETSGGGNAVLRLILTRGGSGGGGYAPLADGQGPTRILWLEPWSGYPPHFAREGVAVCYCKLRLARQPRLAGLKHLNRLEQVLARVELPPDCPEGLMCDDRDHVIEGTMTNLFAVYGGVLRTPDLSECGVEGVMRAEVLARAAALGLRCECAPITRAALARAEEIFLTNSLIGLWPVRRVEDKVYPVGPVTRRIQASLHADEVVPEAA
jgi:4-amino-4-deoxychorismate lyase